MGGFIPAQTGATEEYNGASWTTSTNLSTARHVLGGGGIQTDAVAFGGAPTSPGYTGATEQYNGSTWTTGGTMNQARGQLVGAGASGSAAIGVAGYYPPGVYANNTELYDGTSWTNEATISTGRSDTGAAGTTQAALLFGGFAPPARTAATEEWLGAGSPQTKTITAS
jgi:hypothetical protein